MGDLVKIPFKIENRGGNECGYPCLNWFYDGLRYEAILDTGADNNLFPFQFLKLLSQSGVVDLDEIYTQNKFFTSSGVGGSMSTTHPILLKIELRLNSSVFLNLMINFCIPPDKMAYDCYMNDQLRLPKLENDLMIVRDTKLKQKFMDDYNRIKKNIQKFNPPFLFGKPFISKLEHVKFVINNEMANKDSYFEFIVKDSCIVA
ncbi:MAG: hypothetical protein Q8P62_05450 [Candidatus Peregrinibacteria bacterium]|nr:hypothetical protein [Candidatus Peregrinibacteria bacterium]